MSTIFSVRIFIVLSLLLPRSALTADCLSDCSSVYKICATPYNEYSTRIEARELKKILPPLMVDNVSTTNPDKRESGTAALEQYPSPWKTEFDGKTIRIYPTNNNLTPQRGFKISVEQGKKRCRDDYSECIKKCKK